MALTEDKNEFSLAKKIHFTYKEDIDKTSLCQGDVLEITDDLAETLKKVHPYFSSEHYKYFLVLSQSCDLVRRNGKTCKTQYITLAAVRSFDSFLHKKLIEEKYVEQVNGLLLMDDKQKERAYQLIERIYNNNEPEYFFLFKEEALGFPESMIAYLRVSIALKSNEHYDECLRAKIMELSDEFKAKLGWLVGYMYSRVGTADWEGIMSSHEKTEMLNEELNQRCIIGSKERIKLLKKELVEKVENVPNHDAAISMLANINIPTKYEETMEVIEEIFRTSSKKIPFEEKESILKAIKSREKLRLLLSK